MINVLFAALPERWDSYAPALRKAFDDAGLQVDLQQDFAPEEVDLIDVDAGPVAASAAAPVAAPRRGTRCLESDAR